MNLSATPRVMSSFPIYCSEILDTTKQTVNGIRARFWPSPVPMARYASLRHVMQDAKLSRHQGQACMRFWSGPIKASLSGTEHSLPDSASAEMIGSCQNLETPHVLELTLVRWGLCWLPYWLWPQPRPTLKCSHSLDRQRSDIGLTRISEWH